MSERRNINERLDELGALLASEDLRTGKGLMNEENIRIFDYSPEDEMAVRRFVKMIESNKSDYGDVKVFNLFDVFLDLCNDCASVKDIVAEEEYSGSEYILEIMQDFADNKSIVNKMLDLGMNDAAVVVLTGLGEIYPIARLHLLLSALQPYRDSKAVVALYPGEFTGEQVKLFNKLAPSNYYRAIGVIK